VRAIIHERTGGPEVLKLVDRPDPEPGPGEVVVAVAVSGVNPTDWKSREGKAPGEPLRFPQVVPNQDGAGTVTAVGDGVDPGRVGQRVWLWEGAHHVVNYRSGEAAEAIRAVAPDGVDLIVEVAPVANAALDRDVLAGNATVAIYARDGDELSVLVFPAMRANTRVQFVLVYTVSAAAKDRAVRDVSAAVAAGALRVGADAGLPLHRFPLDRTGEAHAAVEHGAVGKVLVDVG